MSAGRRAGWVVCLFSLAYSILLLFSLMFPWGRVGRPCGGTYEMSAGRSRGGMSVYLTLLSLFYTNFH